MFCEHEAFQPASREQAQLKFKLLNGREERLSWACGCIFHRCAQARSGLTDGTADTRSQHTLLRQRRRS
eukprot:6212744-Pleurochrysis_carterae.AAC.8